MYIRADHIGLVLLLGAGVAVICRASPIGIVEGASACGPEFNLTKERDFGLLMVMAMSADDYEVIMNEEIKCLADCAARKAGYLNSNGSFTVSEFIQKQKNKVKELEETKQENLNEDEYEKINGTMNNKREQTLETMAQCEDLVENWNRTGKCEKGYLFSKCLSWGKNQFESYMDLQNNVSNGSLKPYETPYSLELDYDSYDDLNMTQEVEQLSNLNGKKYILVNVTSEQEDFVDRMYERDSTTQGIVEPKTQRIK